MQIGDTVGTERKVRVAKEVRRIDSSSPPSGESKDPPYREAFFTLLYCS